MGQMNLYLPDFIEERIRSESKKQHKSISAFMSEMAQEKLGLEENWPKDFFSLAGSWEGDFPQPMKQSALSSSKKLLWDDNE